MAKQLGYNEFAKLIEVSNVMPQGSDFMREGVGAQAVGAGSG